MIKSSKKKASKARMVKDLDKDATKRVFERDQNTCQRCGKIRGEWDQEKLMYVVLQPSHIHSRRHYCIRWDEENILAKCSRCHMWFENNKGLGYDWFIKNWPERWERITRTLQFASKVTDARVKELWSELRTQ